jgi:hypothetical protein
MRTERRALMATTFPFCFAVPSSSPRDPDAEAPFYRCFVQSLWLGGRAFMPKQRRCPFCRRLFVSDPRVKERQQTCGRPSCRRERKRQIDAQWRARHADYFRGMYPQQKQARSPDFMRLKSKITTQRELQVAGSAGR